MGRFLSALIFRRKASCGWRRAKRKLVQHIDPVKHHHVNLSAGCVFSPDGPRPTCRHARQISARHAPEVYPGRSTCISASSHTLCRAACQPISESSHGMQEVVGSNPIGSITNSQLQSPVIPSDGFGEVDFWVGYCLQWRWKLWVCAGIDLEGAAWVLRDVSNHSLVWIQSPSETTK